MICKDDLVSWFKNLESYKRIDVMCTLLNLCLPFELRFLGTCLEELGRRDAQDLRGVELRVNNPQEFVSDVGSFQSGQPTDMKIRRKMALYLALMRACNRTGVNELFKTLDRWGDRDFSKFSDGDPLQELLLVYTMATNHPVFSFEQRLKCGEIYSKITSSKAHLNQQQQQQSSTSTSPITSPLSSSFNVQQQQHQTSAPSPPPQQQFQSGTFQQPTPQMINPAATQQQIPNQIIMPMPFPQALIPADPTIALPVESLTSHLVSAPPSMVQIPTDFSTPPPHWQMRYPQIYPAIVPIEAQPQYPQASSSPHISQPSSPTHSRTGSPTRQQQQQQQQPPTNPSHRNSRAMRNTRPSAETTPPPLPQQQQQASSNTQTSQQTQQGSGTTINYMGNDIMVQTLKNFDEINMDGAISQLHSLTIRNGYNRPSNTIPRQNKQPNWPSLPWQQQPPPPPYAVHLVDASTNQLLQHKSVTTGSESGSSTGDMSPPPQQAIVAAQGDPTGMHGNTNQTQSSGLRNKQALNLNRINGGAHPATPSTPQMHQSHSNNSLEFVNGAPANAPTLVSSNSSGNLLLISGGQMHSYPTYRNLPSTTTPTTTGTPLRQYPAQVNGEIVYQFSTGTPGAPQFIPTQTQIVAPAQRVSPSQTPPVIATALPTPYPTSKLVQSCFNCGSINHTGLNCSEASMEDVTRNAIYKLDYTVSNTQLPIQFASVPMMTPSLSSGNLNMANNNNNSNNSSSNNNNPTQSSNNQNTTNNSDPEPSSITFIDLTQDTSSDSSISNR